MARNQIAKKSIDGMVVGFAFTGGKALTLDVAGLSQEMRDRLAVHGAVQKVGDSYAGAETVADAYDRASAVITALKDGSWGVERAEADQTLFNETLAKLRTDKGNPTTPEQAAVLANREGNVYPGGLDAKAWQKALRGTPEFIRAAAEIRALRQTKPADIGSLLDVAEAAPASV